MTVAELPATAAAPARDTVRDTARRTGPNASPGTADTALEAAVTRAADALAAMQRPDGHWVFELEADATIPAEYVLLRHYLGEVPEGPGDTDVEGRIGRYLRRIQGADHDGWGLFHDGAFDISASVKAYFALKMIGDDPCAEHMVRARGAILGHGGAAAVNVFTRIQLALFAAGPWSAIPTMPPELILAPRWFPVHLSKMAYWARTVIVPLLVLCALKPVARNPRGIRVDELYLPKATVRPKSNVAGARAAWRLAFGALDVALKAGDRLWPRRLRRRAIDACTAFVVERLNGDDGLGAIYPAIANSVMMFDALGDAAHRDVARAAVEKLIVRRDAEDMESEVYCQPCLSPVWDTALAAHAMLEVRSPSAEAAADAGLDWLLPRQVLDVRGDWADNAPDLRPGGWAFQYANAHYPDLDDTAAVVCALDRARGRVGGRFDEAIARGIEWTVGLQSKDGGWGAFDADNSYHYLNSIPFADHGALLDPPTADVSARVVSMLAQLGEPAGSERMGAAVAYLLDEQEADGSWFGRWGVNYIYGTWSALCALNAAGLTGSDAVSRAADWLTGIQNPDGGWGEACDSYALDRTGHVPADSRASQTAWALLGLMASGAVDHPAVARGVAWLTAGQGPDGVWPEEHHTGGGFPRVFYLRYHGYAKIFPLWALARYRNLRAANTTAVGWGL